MSGSLGYYGPPLRALPAGIMRDWFAYTTNITFTALNQRQPLTIQLDGSADFELCQVSAQTTDTPQPQIMALCNVKDTTTGYSLLNDQAPIESISTTLARVSPLDATHVFRSNASIQLDLTNKGSATQQLYITLRGFKWWNRGNTPAGAA